MESQEWVAIQAGSTTVLAILTGWYAWRTHKLAQSAERQVKSLEKQSTAQIFFELYRTYNTPKLQEAIETIHDTYRKWQETWPDNQRSQLNEKRYHFGQWFWNNKVDQGDEIDRRRRRVTHFWYQVGFLLEKQLLDAGWVFAAFGPPDIVDILEPIEVILADEVIRSSSRRRLWDQRQKWPPMFVLRKWKTDEPSEKTLLLGIEVPPDDMVPVNKEYYDRYRAEQNAT